MFIRRFINPHFSVPTELMGIFFLNLSIIYPSYLYRDGKGNTFEFEVKRCFHLK